MKKAASMVVVALAMLGIMTGVAFAHDTTIMLMEENNSGQTGTVVFTGMDDGTTKVTIELSNGSTEPQPAHIHAGHCGPTLDPMPAYPLSNVVNGRSETIVAVDVHDLTGGTFAVNVHKSAAEAQIYVACGNIVAMTEHEESAPGMPRTGGAQDALSTGLAVFAACVLAGLGVVLRRKARTS